MNFTDPLLQITDSSIDKYKTAGIIAKKSIDTILKSINKNTLSMVTLIKVGEEFIERELKNVHKNINYKGISFPLCLSKNEVAGHYRPTDNDTLSHGDVLKIEVGVHIDGYSSNLVYTTVIKLNETEPLNQRHLEALKACIYASKDVVGLMKVGKSTRDIVNILNKYAQKYNCQLAISNERGIVPGVFSYQIGRNVLNGRDGENTEFVHRFVIPRENPAYDFDTIDNMLEEDEVYSIDIIMSVGSGRLNKTGSTSIFSRDYERTVPLKLQSSKQVLGLFKGKYFPQVVDQTDGKVKLGLGDCVKKGIIKEYPVVSDSQNEVVVRVKFTVIVKEKPLLVCGKVADSEIDKFK